jgi:hypothetical protein
MASGRKKDEKRKEKQINDDNYYKHQADFEEEDEEISGED